MHDQKHSRIAHFYISICFCKVLQNSVNLIAYSWTLSVPLCMLILLWWEQSYKCFVLPSSQLEVNARSVVPLLLFLFFFFFGISIFLTMYTMSIRGWFDLFIVVGYANYFFIEISISFSVLIMFYLNPLFKFLLRLLEKII